MENFQSKVATQQEIIRDAYGAHFKYEDLFARLVKLKKETSFSGSPPNHGKTISLEANIKKISKTSQEKPRKSNKRPTSSFNATTNRRKQSTVKKKTAPEGNLKQRKNIIFRTFSPSQALKTITINLDKKKMNRSEKSK
jgi:hypothetical protein